MGIGTGPPFEDKVNCLVGQKVQDGQVNIKLILFVRLHLPGKREQA